MRHAWIGLVVLCACRLEDDYVPPPDTGDTEPVVCEPDDGPACGAWLVAADPEDGADKAYYRDDLVLTFAEAAGEVRDLELVRDADPADTDAGDSDTDVALPHPGGPVAGTWTMASDGLTGRFSPDAPLDPEVGYTWTVERSCCDPISGRFTTSATGQSVPPGRWLQDHFQVDLLGGTWSSGEGLREVDGLDTAHIVLTPQDYNGESGTFRIDLAAVFDPGGGLVQDRCNPTGRLPERADYEDNPFFEVEASIASTWVSGLRLTWHDLRLEGAIGPRTTKIDGVRWTGRVEVDPLVDVLGGDLDDACDAMAAAGTACEACPTGGSRCVAVDVRDVPTTQWEGTLDPIADAVAEANRGAGTCE